MVRFRFRSPVPATGGSAPLSPGGERVWSYGGDGTPQIPEFTICEVAAALGLSQQSAVRLVGDVLDITCRLPILYAALEDGRIELWRVRKVAAATRDLSEPLAHEVDIRLSAAHSIDHSPLLARASAARVAQIIDQVRGTIAPENRDDDVETNLADRYVEFRDDGPGVTDLEASLSKADAARLKQRLRIVVGWLGNSATAAPPTSSPPRRPAGSPNPTASPPSTNKSSTTAGWKPRPPT